MGFLRMDLSRYISVVGYYSGMIFYSIHYEMQHDEKIFGKSAVLVSVKDFKTCLMNISSD